MRARMSAVVGVAGLALVVAGCVSLNRTEDARFFVLESVALAPAPTGSSVPVGLVGIEAVRLPGHLDRPQLVTWAGPNELRVDEFLRWAEPLEDGIIRTITENLAGLLPEYRVIRRPWPGAAKPRSRVVVYFKEFGLQRDGMVRLSGRMALLPGEGELPLVMAPVDLSRGPVSQAAEGSPVDPGVDEMSQLLADLSRQIAQAIQTLPPVEKPVALEKDTLEAEDVESR